MLSLWPSSLIDRLIAILVIILIVLVSIYAVYRHFENTQNRLVQAAAQAAQEKVVVDYQAQSSELLREKTEVTAGALTNLVKQNSAASNATEDLQAVVQEITEPQPPINKEETSNAKAPDPAVVQAVDALNRSSDTIDGLLESSSRAGKAKR